MERTSLFFISTEERKSSCSEELVATGQTQPASLHFEIAPPKLRIRLVPRRPFSRLGVLTTFPNL